MPFPRPVTPITFETCSPPAEGIGDDDLLGSDDELDDTARAAKRQRVEKLAESYLRGNQLFLLSASLRGPFEEGWKNPWKKNRRSRSDAGPTRSRSNGVARHTERVVQETDLREPKHREDLSVSRPRPSVADTSIAPKSPAAPSRESNSAGPRSGQKRPMKLAARDEQNLAQPRSTKKPKEAFSCTTDDQAIGRARTVDWLKKDRKRMNFKDFEPPSSPTPKIGARQAENKLRRSAPRTGEGKNLKTTSRLGTPRRSAASESVHTTPQSAQTVVPISYEASEGTRQSPQKEQASPKPEGRAASSFRVISSTSQLPRFEYRRWHQDSSPQGPLESPAKETAGELAAATAATDQDGDLSVPDAPAESESEARPCNSPHAADQPAHRSKDLRFVDDHSASNAAGTSPQAVSEQDTCENLPSAQQVSAPHEISDRMPSLHSTALPKTDAAPNTGPSPDTQLSTQAALLHAQKSFQDDLESREQVFGKTPGERVESPAADDSVLLAHETPYYQPNTSEKALLRSARKLVNNMQAMSTQCMLDAATPYTFSTEKKPHAYRIISPRHIGVEKPQTKPNPQDLTNSSGTSSPSAENEYQMAQSSAGGSSPREVVQPPDQPPTHRSTTQGTALPFNLSESTPTTAQDGQGGLQGAESFDLSQAIADAGSWLQQSFDFLKEIRQPSQHA